MTRLEIRPLDAADEEQMAAWYAVYEAANTVGRAFPTPLKLEELRPQFLAEDTGEKNLVFSGYVDGRVVTVGRVDLPLRDNLHRAWVDVLTHPDQCGNGYGSAMLEHLTQVAREHGRRTLNAETVATYDGPADGRGQPGSDFLAGHGFTFALGDVMRVLDLPADEEPLRRLAEEAASHHADYTIRLFSGRVPDDLIEGFATLLGSLITEAPSGEVEVEPEHFDEQRIRADERVFEASGRRKYTAVAIAADGSAAGYTEIAVPSHDPGKAYQWGTLVLPGHRGHRLGLAMKVAVLLWLQREEPDLRHLVTFNAEVNSHMVSVNEAMGFRPVERLAEYQRQL